MIPEKSRHLLRGDEELGKDPKNIYVNEADASW